MTTEARTNHDSRWHRPNLYWTVAGLFLVFSTIMTTSITTYVQYTTPPNNSGIGLNLQITATAIALSILAVFSIIGAVKLFTRRNPVTPSIIALSLWAFFYFLLVVGEAPLNSTNISYHTSGAILVCLDAVMIVFVIQGRKMMYKKDTSN